jgi:DNA mismatch repair protein MutS2
LNPKHLNTLEFPKILNRLAHHADFSASKELARALLPACYLTDILEKQIETREARRLLSVNPDVSIGGARDVRPLLKQATRSAALLPTELLDIRQTLVAARNLSRVISRLQEQMPRLADIAARIQECPGLIQEIGRCISDQGEVLDSASPDLARIRNELGVVHQRLLDRLNKIVQSPRNGPYLQETFVTQRQGRYVIPLRAEFKGRIKGVVHDQSASGATIFLEPLATVELNNRWRQLQIEEEEEVRRVLLALSALVAQEAKHIAWTVEAIAELDLAFAKAKYAEELDAVEPEWPGSGADRSRPIRLLAARHPLLDPETVVPVDVVMPPETHILVITGPNTGGKTVTLKTVGLLVAMAQAGLHIPAAEGSALPLFKGLYADIGDEQSIEQSLSTFSSHLTNIVRILAECDEGALVILDELGAGTDPVEGSALARAILSYLRECGVTTLVATHYSELKAYAHTTPGVANASVEFNAETLAPTYRLTIGLPGRSNAFAIAQRLGLDESIILAAQDMVSPEAMKTEAMLRDIQAQLDVVAHERTVAEAARVQVEKHLRELRQRLSHIDEERRDILNSARADAHSEIKAVRQELRRLRDKWSLGFQSVQASPSEEGASLRQWDRETRETLAKLEATVDVEETPMSPEPRYRGPLQPGDQVWIEPYQALGEVISSHQGKVEVQLGRFRASVKRNQVELQQQSATVETPSEDEGIQSGGVWTPVVESPGLELDLRGQTTEEALPQLERYLDDAYLVGLPWVRIIHGKGTGALRVAVRNALRAHPFVASYEEGKEGEGGDGVTVAKLAVEA